jgi:hypothetical protein
VIDDIEIYRCAKQLLDTHGDEAFAIAEDKFETLAEADDLEGCAVWQQVISAIKELRRQSRQRGEAIH